MRETVGQVRHPALTDQQTGLPNRLHFDTVFEVTFAAARRGIPLTLLLLEIDGFVRWSADAGPAMGGRTLRSLGLTVAGGVRMSDLVARTEEARIAVALLDCDLAGGEVVAQRLQGLLDPFRKEAGLRVSMGGAQARASMVHPEDLISAAERALRAAQARGQDQMELVR